MKKGRLIGRILGVALTLVLVWGGASFVAFDIRSQVQASTTLSYVVYHTDIDMGVGPVDPDIDVMTPSGIEHGNVIDIFRSGDLIVRFDADMEFLRVFDGDASRHAALNVQYREMHNGASHLAVQSNPTIEEDEGKYVLSVDSKTDDDAMISHYTITISEDGSIYVDKNTMVPHGLSTDECSSEDGLVGIHLGSDTVGDGAHIEVYDDGAVYSWDIPSLPGYANVDTSHTLEYGDWVSVTGGQSDANASIKFRVDSTSGYDNWGNASSLAAVIQHGPGIYYVLVGRKDVEMWNPTVLPAGEYSVKGWISVARLLPQPSTECIETATGTGMACFTPSHCVIEDLEAVSAPSPLPHGVRLPHGMFTFKITGLTPGQSITLIVEFPDPIPTHWVWWKYHDNTWSRIPITRTTNPRIITVTLTDGVYPGDEDSIAGQITDQGGPGDPGAVGWDTYPINKVRVLVPWIALFAAVVAGMSILMLRRRRS